jgi:hypothetical protein
LAFFAGFPLNAHPGAFGCTRKHDIHTGIDLYGKPDQVVYNIRDGIVVKTGPFTGPQVGYPWWLDTDAVLVKDDEGMYLYGELKSDLKVGQVIKSGEIVGKLTPVLPDHKHRPDIPGHSTTMLHLERYTLDYNVEEDWAAWFTRVERPSYLLDPTIDLIKILTDKRREYKLLTK